MNTKPVRSVAVDDILRNILEETGPTTAESGSNVLNLLDLPPLQRTIIIHLTRKGPANAEELAQALKLEPAEVEQALDILAQQGHLRLSANGQAQPALGRTRRRNLPARLWPALLAANRLYSIQEIATLRTALPILQFARAKLSEFADHGPGHVLRVKSFAVQLSYIMGLTPMEQHLLRAGAMFHDVGNIIDRTDHHITSQETVHKLTQAGELPFSTAEANLVGLLCRWHRREYDPARCDMLDNNTIRTGLLASILRVADAMDIDQRRSDYTERFAWVLRFFYPDELPYWTSLEEILGVRLHCTTQVNLQILTKGPIVDNIQIAMLRGDLAGTPLPWTVQEVAVPPEPLPIAINGQEPAPTSPQARPALLVFPFDPHSLVMAALSRKHLQAAGYAVELLCYPDTLEAPSWLWQEMLAEVEPTNYSQIIVLNDRPTPAIDTARLTVIERWRNIGLNVSLLNRHEANWSQLPDLLRLGVEVILGGDWAYFWGEPTDQTALMWGRVAAFCTRDPGQATTEIIAAEHAIIKGLLKRVYDATTESADDLIGWAALAEPIMSRIEANDYRYFIDQAANFVADYATITHLGQVVGRVLRQTQSPGRLPQAYYWALEQTIESQGRMPTRGICFNVPYAVATWSDGEAVELLAINHWRDEAAIPIRLLYPTDLGPAPEGNENAIRVRLTAEQAERVVDALVTACNQ
ncbi:MAG: HD domain-containing protein [Anaerolineae bacterium]|nr:HD domain-containing protein [Anaerolineae bacterium]